MMPTRGFAQRFEALERLIEERRSALLIGMSRDASFATTRIRWQAVELLETVFQLQFGEGMFPTTEIKRTTEGTVIRLPMPFAAQFGDGLPDFEAVIRPRTKSVMLVREDKQVNKIRYLMAGIDDTSTKLMGYTYEVKRQVGKAVAEVPMTIHFDQQGKVLSIEVSGKKKLYISAMPIAHLVSLFVYEALVCKKQLQLEAIK